LRNSKFPFQAYIVMFFEAHLLIIIILVIVISLSLSQTDPVKAASSRYIIRVFSFYLLINLLKNNF